MDWEKAKKLVFEGEAICISLYNASLEFDEYKKYKRLFDHFFRPKNFDCDIGYYWQHPRLKNKESRNSRLIAIELFDLICSEYYPRKKRGL